MIKSIQYLRGVAAILVFFHHWVQLGHTGSDHTFLASIALKYGSFGVNLFFVISGFIIAKTVIAKPLNPVKFFSRRIIRIYPAYWVFSLMLAVVIKLFPESFSFTSAKRWSILLSALLIPHHNPSGIGLYPFLTVGWTLSFELFFYSIVFISIFMAKERWIHMSVFLLVALPLLFPRSAWGNHLFGSFHLIEFAAGILIARFYTMIPAMNSSRSAFVGSMLLLAGIISLNLGSSSWGVSAILVVTASLISDGFRAPKLIHFALFHLGNVSYSFYLAHVIIIGSLLGLWRSSFPELSELTMLLVSILLTLVFAWLGFNLVERPAMNLLESTSREAGKKCLA